jgi:predicted mannosyl-3-phosphoglycerate phosphatase (HAD superfamily)
MLLSGGLILRKALKVQKDAEDESTRIAFGNLWPEVIDLRHQAIEKNNIFISLVNKMKESRAELTKFSEDNLKFLKLEDKKKSSAKRMAGLESMLVAQAKSHKSEVLKLKEFF